MKISFLILYHPYLERCVIPRLVNGQFTQNRLFPWGVHPTIGDNKLVLSVNLPPESEYYALPIVFR
jgi:hypothetical protein